MNKKPGHGSKIDLNTPTWMIDAVPEFEPSIQAHEIQFLPISQQIGAYIYVEVRVHTHQSSQL